MTFEEAEVLRLELLNKAHHEQYVALPHTDCWHTTDCLWEIALPGKNREVLHVWQQGSTPLRFTNQQVAEDLATALNDGRGRRYICEP